jgi:hypothetical protein
MHTSASFLLLLCWIGVVSAARADIRVAIVPVQAAAEAPADVLTASFHNVTNLTLVERVEVDKLFGEQKLLSAQAMDCARVGQLLRADGLVLLQPITTPSATNLAVRLVSTGSGVVLDVLQVSLPLKDPIPWGRFVAERFAPLMPKLTVPRSGALRISFLNLRSAVSTPESRQTERLLGTLVYHRLMQEREVFVLERREMGRLDWEKNLAGPDAGEFWTGSHLLEGVLDRDGASPERVTVHWRLTPPGQGAPVEVETTGPRHDLVAVAERLTRQILAALHRETSLVVWDPDKEAARYQAEAEWALRWGMWPEAKAAAESAFALGRCTEEVAGMKVRALLEMARTRESFKYDPIRGAGWAANAPAPEVLPRAQEALEAYLTHCARAGTARWQTNATWLELGLDAVQTAALVLRHHYFHGWRQDQFDAALPELREATRQVAESLPAAAQRVGSRPPFRSPGTLLDLDMLEAPPAWNRAELIGRFGCLWQERPRDAIGTYRALLASGEYARERERILARLWHEPMWVGWSRADRTAGASEWREFVGGLQHSTNRMEAAEGALLALQGARYDLDQRQAGEVFWRATLDGPSQRCSTNVDHTVLDALEQLLFMKAGQENTVTLQALRSALQTVRKREQEAATPAAAATVAASPPRATATAGGGPRGAHPEGSRPNAASSPPAPTTEPAQQEALQVTQCWRPRVKVGEFQKTYAGTFAGPVVSGPGLVVAVPYAGFGSGGYAIQEIGTESEPRELVRGISCGEMMLFRFRATRTHVLWIQDGGVVGCVDRRTGKSQELKLDFPISTATRLAVAREHVFLLSSEYIAEFQPSDGRVTVLASTRRRPSANKLDEWTWPGTPELFECGEQGFLAAFGSAMRRQVWVGSLPSGDWRELVTTPTAVWEADAFNSQLLLTASGTIGFLGLTERGAARTNVLFSDRMALQPRWRSPSQYTHERSVCSSWDGTNLWQLFPEGGGADRRPTLVWFDPRTEQPAVIPLTLNAQPPTEDPGQKPQRLFRLLAAYSGVYLLATEAPIGMMPIIPINRIWFVPKSDLDHWAGAHRRNETPLPPSPPMRRNQTDLEARSL